MKKFFSAALCLGCAAVLGSCSLGVDDMSLLHPPKTTGNEAEIQKLIDETANGGYMLKYPQSGQYRSAIITKDLNSDKKDEAVAFYRTQGNKAQTHMLVMYNNGKSFKSAGVFESEYTDVDCVRFVDYDYDGEEELLVGFSTYTTGINELGVFDLDFENGKAVDTGFRRTYSTFTTGDFDRDGAGEVLTISLATAENAASASLVDYDKSQLYTLSECSMDSGVTRLESVQTGMIDKNTNAVVVDGVLGNEYSTQVIYYDAEKSALLDFPISSGNKKKASTVRAYPIVSDDIDDDGYIEIPVVEDTSVKTLQKGESAAPLVSWSSFNPEKVRLKEKIRCVNNFSFGYLFTLPKDYDTSVEAVLSDSGRTMKLYFLSGGKRGALMLTVKVSDVSSESGENEGFETLESYNQYVFVYKIEPNSPLYFDDNIVKENFSLNESI